MLAGPQNEEDFTDLHKALGLGQVSVYRAHQNWLLHDFLHETAKEDECPHSRRLASRENRRVEGV